VKKKLAPIGCRRKPFVSAPANRERGWVASWANGYFFVQVKPFHAASGRVGLVLAIQTVRSANKADGQNDITWADKQWIKNVLCGHEAWAIEQFPPESKLSDVADIYWLWVYPAGDGPGFDLAGGIV
jgi:hypothetical protein